jgi:uncharacterized protein YndB with AHSA1/START domain
MLKISGIVIVVAVAAFLTYVAMKPDAFRIERTQRIKAAPETLFALMNDLRGFNRWNPFAQGDPSLKIDYTGPDNGTGAAYTWTGAGKTGQGRMEIAESTSPSRVTMRLDFSKPFVAHNKVEFTITPEGSMTKVAWVMTGRNAYLNKVMGTLFNMDRMVGKEFEKGLMNLKTLAEGTH